MPQSLIKILSFFLSFCLILEQGAFAQTIDLSHYFARNPAQTIPQSDKFRPLHLRYISYDSKANDFKILLDKGDFFNQKTEKPKNEKTELENTTQELMKYFFIGLALPNEKFWVNLRPDSPDDILDPDLEKTDVGRIFLEADLQLKKDTAGMTSPQTKEGREYWDKLYKKAGELFPAAGGSALGGGSENITIPTLTRPWIVPNEIVIREAPDNAYIYKATLKVMLEEDYLKKGNSSQFTVNSAQNYNFSDPRLKELNQYSTQLIKETIIPKLTYAVNTAKRYAQLRQVYYSLILAQWFKQKYGSSGNIRAPGSSVPVNSYIDLIDSGNLTNLASSQSYDKQSYFQQYQKSFKDGEYNLQEPVYAPLGQSIRKYMSGGTFLGGCSSTINIVGEGNIFKVPQYLIQYESDSSISSPMTPKSEDNTSKLIGSLIPKLRGNLLNMIKKSDAGNRNDDILKPEDIRENLSASEYISVSEYFQGVDLEHFVHAQYRLAAERDLSEKLLKKVLAELNLKISLSGKEAYDAIYGELGMGRYTKEIIDLINQGTYTNPRLETVIDDQNSYPKIQSVYEAVANSLDALGSNIGQFGKGVKQALDWLKQEGDKIEVITMKKGYRPYCLTIIRSKTGQNYIQIREIAQDELVALAGKDFKQGTILKIKVKDKIPRMDNEPEKKYINSQEVIINGLRRRFPWVRNVEVWVQGHKLNNFKNKMIIVQAGESGYVPIYEETKKLIRVDIDDHSITVIDNGGGMDARAISKMFVPKEGSKHPVSLSGDDARRELKKVEVIYDPRLPDGVSFSRNNEVIVYVPFNDNIVKDALLEGGLMIEFASLLDVQESRDQIIIPADLKPSEVTNFQLAIEYVIGKIVNHKSLTAQEKLKYVNTITVGLDGLVKDNPGYEYVIKSVRANIRGRISSLADALKNEGIIFLPHNKQFDKVLVTGGRKVVFLHEKLFDWRGAVSLREIGGELIRGITLGGDKHLPLLTIPFKENYIVNVFDKNWHSLKDYERNLFIRQDSFVAIPSQIDNRVKELADKRFVQGLNPEEEKEFLSFLERINILTSSEVVTDYEVAGKIPKNMNVPGLPETIAPATEIDRRAISNFLVRPPTALKQQPGDVIPIDANQTYELLSNGELVDLATGEKMASFSRGATIEFLRNNYYLVREPQEKKEYIINIKMPYYPWLEIDIEKGGIVFSPNKDFAYVLNGERFLVEQKREDFVYDYFDLIRGERGKLGGKESGYFSKHHDHPLRKLINIQPQFSADGNYLVCVAYEEPFDKAPQRYLRAFNLKTGRLVKNVLLGADVYSAMVDYKIDPLTNFIYLWNANNESFLIDLNGTNLSRVITENARGFYTDPIGAYTAIFNAKSDTVEIYVHNSRKKLEIDDIQSITSIFDYSDARGHVVVDKHKNHYYFDAQFNPSAEFFALPGRGEFGVEVSAVRGSIDLIRMVAGNEVVTNSYELGERRIYKHPKFPLIINASKDNGEIIVMGRQGQSQMTFDAGSQVEIIDYSPNGVLWWRSAGGIFKTEFGYPEKREFVGEIKAKGADSSKEWYVLFHPNNKYVLLAAAAGGSMSILNKIRHPDFDNVNFDGKYFVFVNSQSGEAVYLDPQHSYESYHISSLPSGAEIGGMDLDVVSLWNKMVLNKKSFWISQAQESYAKFIKEFPAMFGERVILDMFSDGIDKLYRDQEDIIKKLFLDGLEGNPVNWEVGLPFDTFSQRVNQIVPLLSSYIDSVKDILAQEHFDVQMKFFSNIFKNLFLLSLSVDLPIASLENKLFEPIAMGWSVLDNEHIQAAGTIGRLIDELRLANPGIDMEEIMALVEFLDGVAQESGLSVVVTQINKILDREEQTQRAYLTKLAAAFNKNKIKGIKLIEYLKNIDSPDLSYDTKVFVVFLSRESELVKEDEIFVPNGRDINIPPGGIRISQVANLELSRIKKGNDIVMDMDYLLANIHNLPGASEAMEAEILRNTNVQAESGAYAREITQNSKDAGATMLRANFYKNRKYFVEEISDNGTGALQEAALLIPKSTKAKGGQIDAGGFFGTGKYTIFEGIDRLEIISKNKDRGYMFSFDVFKDASGKAELVELSGIREISDSGVKTGVTVRRMKLIGNTIPELDQMIAKQNWRIFSGLSTGSDFNIYFAGYEKREERLNVKREVLSQAEFKEARHERGAVNFVKIVSCEDMPLQIVDRLGLRVGEMKKEYLASIPEYFHKYLKNLGIVIQIPLPLIRNRSGFEHEDVYLPLIQKYVAIAFYRAIAYKALTQVNPQFTFEGFSLDLETNELYADAINQSHKDIVEMAERINQDDYESVSVDDLKLLFTSDRDVVDKEKKALRLIILLKVPLDQNKPSERTSLIGRRLAVQKSNNNAKGQNDMLKDMGYTLEDKDIPPPREIPFYDEKIQQAENIKVALGQLRRIDDFLVEPENYNLSEKALVDLAIPVAKKFGLEHVFLANNEVRFAGGFTVYKGKERLFIGKPVMVLNQALALKIGVKSGEAYDKATYTIIHELAHLLEEYMREDVKTVLGNGYVAYVDDSFTHDSVGPFADAMKYISGLWLMSSSGSSSILVSENYPGSNRVIDYGEGGGDTTIVGNKGGIDFNALPIQTESIASSALGALSGGRAFKGDLDAEWANIQAVFNAGVRPSIQRLSEYTAAASASPLAEDKIDQVRVMLADILRRDEESQKIAPTEESCKQLLRTLESG